MLGAVNAHYGQHGLGAKGTQERADVGGSPSSVFQIDENKLGTGRSDDAGQPERVELEDHGAENKLVAGEAPPQRVLPLLIGQRSCPSALG